MPTALARPWPSGPVVVSTPGVTPTSGCPGVRLCSWRKLRSSLIGSLVANVRHNLNRKIAQVRVFEIGRVYVRTSEAVRFGVGEDSQRNVVLSRRAILEEEAGSLSPLDRFYTLNGIAGCCARATSGQAAAPPTTPMHARRVIIL